LIGGAAALPLAPRAFAGAAVGTERTLVLLQLSGGNDGLSTVVPWADDVYHELRPNIALPPDDVLKLDDYRGLHPQLARLREVHERGGMAIVEGVGYPNPIRSHFKSMDVWHTADMRGRAAGEGWIGRLARSAFSELHDPNLIVHVGANVPYSLYSTTHPPASFVMPRSYRWAGDEAQTEAYERAGEMTEERPESHLDYVRKVLAEGQVSSARIRQAAASYSTPVEYPGTRLGAALHDAAALIGDGVGSRVISVEHIGFDTHTTQVGRHRSLLRQFDQGLGAFLEDLERSEAGRETLVLVFSEFGRRVAENGAEGTDHGVAAPVFAFGAKVKGGLYGAHPSLEDLDDGDLRHTTDFRRVYATVIERWFGAKAKRVLDGEFAPLEFV
jgi:uncharacterized protein (DUF1501 family)